MVYESESVARIQNLRKISSVFFDKSLACTKMADVKAFFDLAQQANESADILESDLKIESCWVYLHFVQFFDYSESYSDYLEFCVRNCFSPVSEQDLVCALSYKSTAIQSAEVSKITEIQ